MHGAIQLYRESPNQANTGPITMPVGCCIFPKEIFHGSRRSTEERLPQLIHWNELSRGGHFVAFEQPEILVNDLRACGRQLCQRTAID